MPYQIRSQNRDQAALSDVLPQFAGNDQDDQVLGLTESANSIGTMNTHIHAAGDTPPDQAQAAVNYLKQTMDQQLGRGSADRLLAQAGLQNASQVTVGELKTLGAAYQQEIDALQASVNNLNRPEVQQWNNVVQNGVPGAPVGAAENLEQLLADPGVQWSVSESGSGGALIARTQAGTGAVVKIEDLDAVRKAEVISASLENAFAGGGGAYQVAAISNESDNPAAKQALLNKVVDMQAQNAGNPDALRFLQKHQTALAQNDVGISKMNFVTGTQLNKLPIEDKVALLQSGELSRELGRAAVLCPMVGLSDHAAPSAANLPTNLSNFLIDANTGKLAPIDFDTRDAVNGVASLGDGVQSLSNLVQEASRSQEDYDRVVTNLMAELQTGEELTALGGPMTALSPNGNNEGLFSTPEKKVFQGQQLPDELLRRQAVNMLNGAIDGLEYLQQNEQTIRGGLALGNQAQLDQAFDSVQGIDFNQMRQNVNQHEQAHQAGHEQGQNGHRSVRDMLRGAATNVSNRLQNAAQDLRNNVVNRLDNVGGEQRLRDVDPAKVNDYKTLQAELKGLQKAGGRALDAAMDGNVEALDNFDANREDNARRIAEIKQEMSQMKQENPGLAQLDRNSVGQNIHSGVRDAAKSVANRLR